MSKGWKTLPSEQGSSDILWEMTRDFNCYLVKAQGLTLSRDPLNLTGLNTRRDSGIANNRAIGITISTKQQTIKEKKAKKKAHVVKFNFNVKNKKTLPKSRLVALKGEPTNNNSVISSQRRITPRAIVKILSRGLVNYRKDLLPLAYSKLRRLHKFKRVNKRTNRSEAKKVKV
jgi:hypothetical protein